MPRTTLVHTILYVLLLAALGAYLNYASSVMEQNDYYNNQ